MRVLLKPKWIAGHLLVITLVVTFVSLGLWQLRRHESRVQRNNEIVAGMAAEPRPLDQLPSSDRAYRRTIVQGRYRPDVDVLLTPRNEHGPGHHALTPLELDDGRILIVDRGWLPFRLDTPPISQIQAPAETVVLEGVLLPKAQADPQAVRNEAGRVLRVRAVDPLALGGPQTIPDVFLLLQKQTPPQDGLPAVAPPPAPETGPHQSYAVQWFIFALVGLVGYPFLLRRTLRESA